MRRSVTASLIASALATSMVAAPAFSTEGYETPIPTAQGAADITAVQAKNNYIVVLRDSATAAFQGTADLAAPERTGGRLDVTGAATNQHVRFLQQQQAAFLDDARTALGRDIDVMLQMQHAINAVVVSLTSDEAAAMAAMPEVRLMEPQRNYYLDTDVGPALIGAAGIWNGSNTGGAPGTRGEGMVVGIIDSGINHDHPSFAAVSQPGTVEEYTHTNPLGAGNFIGFCAENPTSPDFVCNDKLIGAYEFTFPVVQNDPNAIEDEVPDDENGHGSHVASTAIGNVTTANYLGADPQVSGVAPRANVIAYDVCYTTVDSNLGACPNVSTLAAINQVVADGIVDVINYSISGGARPWDEANSIAFLNAVEAGVFVSASAGNSGPGADTLGHQEPWVASVAAASHGRFFADGAVDSGSFTGIGAVEGTGAALTSTITNTIRFFEANSEGCNAGGGIPAGTYDDGGDGTLALISRGTCGFAEKVANAEAAGAQAVVVFNNRPGTPFSMGALEGTTIPAFMISQDSGEQIRDEIIANAALPAETAAVLASQDPALPFFDAGSADIVASFSSRGPNDENIVKPDIAGPGVAILAAFADGAGASGAPEFQILQGTSMSSPHNAGAATLVRALRPDWTPSEVKSALMMTANPVMQDDNGDGTIGTATPFDMGAGRVDLTNAALSPVVLDETARRYAQADPALDGDARTLNLASMSDDACADTCSWTRTLRSVSDVPVSFTATFVGDGEMTGTITPSSFTILPGRPQVITIEADTTGVTTRDEWKFARVELDYGEANPLGMPVTVFPLGAVGSITPDNLFAQLDPDTATSADLTIASSGGSDLVFDINPNAKGDATIVDQPTSSNGGILSRFIPGVNGIIAADDMTLGGTTTITSVTTEGFQNGADLVNTALQVNLYIWADDGGVPAGSPFAQATNSVYEIAVPVPSAGLSLDGDTITLDLVELGNTAMLDAGTYWIGVLPITTASWGWFYGPSETGTANAVLIGAAFGVPAWTPLVNLGIAEQSLNLNVNAQVDCGAPWLTEDPTSGVLAPGTSSNVTVTFDSTGFTRGSYGAFECAETNEAATPSTVIPVTMIVNNTAPVVSGETLTVAEAGTATTVDIAEPSLLANDSDFDGDTLTVSTTAVTPPANGELVLNEDGTFSYTHDGSETTSDSFEYEVCDNAPDQGCATGTVAITITGDNDAPVAAADSLTVAENGAATILDSGAASLLANDVDPESDVMTVSATPTVEPVNGAVTLNPDGTFQYIHDGSETTSDSFDYEVCDTSAACSTATVTVLVVNVNTAPIAVADTVEVLVGKTTTQTSSFESSLLANDTDREGNVLTVSFAPASPPSLGDLSLNADGTFSYTSRGAVPGVDTFSYEVCDNGQPQECSVGEVTVNIVEALDEVILNNGFEGSPPGP